MQDTKLRRVAARAAHRPLEPSWLEPRRVAVAKKAPRKAKPKPRKPKPRKVEPSRPPADTTDLPLFTAPAPELTDEAPADPHLLHAALEFGGPLAELVPQSVADEIFELSDVPQWQWRHPEDFERIELASPTAQRAMTQRLREHLQGALQ